MAQDRLSGLSFLSIENNRARNINLSDIVKFQISIVKQFAEKKVNRIKRFTTRTL